MIKKSGFRGYVTHNKFGDYKIPVPAQNIIYRDYVNKKGLLFKLSVSEIFVEGCYFWRDVSDLVWVQLADGALAAEESQLWADTFDSHGLMRIFEERQQGSFAGVFFAVN